MKPLKERPVRLCMQSLPVSVCCIQQLQLWCPDQREGAIANSVYTQACKELVAGLIFFSHAAVVLPIFLCDGVK
eukprot:scaffold621192_cov18-Prasinocladus_malaysianus.AAC.1